MQVRFQQVYILAAITLLVHCHSSMVGEEPPERDALPLSQKMNAAWLNELVFLPGWAGICVDHLDFAVKRTELKATRAVPAFRVTLRVQGVFDKLPAPESPFGLDFSNATATDATLKDISKFKSLSTLNLSRTSVTDAGMKDLDRFSHLTLLDLSFTKVTDLGVIDIAKLSHLSALNFLWHQSDGCRPHAPRQTQEAEVHHIRLNSSHGLGGEGTCQTWQPHIAQYPCEGNNG